MELIASRSDTWPSSAFSSAVVVTVMTAGASRHSSCSSCGVKRRRPRRPPPVGNDRGRANHLGIKHLGNQTPRRDHPAGTLVLTAVELFYWLAQSNAII